MPTKALEVNNWQRPTASVEQFKMSDDPCDCGNERLRVFINNFYRCNNTAKQWFKSGYRPRLPEISKTQPIREPLPMKLIDKIRSLFHKRPDFDLSGMHVVRVWDDGGAWTGTIVERRIVGNETFYIVKLDRMPISVSASEVSLRANWKFIN